MLLKKERPHLLLVGESRSGKTSLVKLLAREIAEQNYPGLNDFTVYAVSVNSLLAGTMYRGQFEQKIETLFNQLKVHENAILFIDEAHMLVQAGSSQGQGGMNDMLSSLVAGI